MLCYNGVVPCVLSFSAMCLCCVVYMFYAKALLSCILVFSILCASV